MSAMTGEAFGPAALPFNRDFDPDTVAWVLDDDSLAMLEEAISTALEVVIDLETTGLQEYAWLNGPMNGGYPARIVLASLTIPQPDDAGDPTTWVVPLSHPDSPWLGRWRRVMRRIAVAFVQARVPLSNHNMKFDARWVYAHAGVDVSKLIVWDTRISAHALDENRSTKLKDIVPVIFGVPRWDDDFDFSIPGEAETKPMFDLGLYAARDTYWTWRTKHHHAEIMYLEGDHDRPETPEEIEYAKLGRLQVWCAMPTVATLTAIEQRGMVLDIDWVKHELAEHQTVAANQFDWLAHRYDGFDPSEASFAPTALFFRAWADRAVDEGDLVVGALTPQGKPQWSKSVLGRQARKGSEVAERLLDYRGHMKKAEFLTSWLNCVTQQGTIHTTYNAGYVVTGRLSSSDPNMQQVTQVLKPAFVPRLGYYFGELDYSQIELRAAAHISGCKPMIEAFWRGDDLHRLLAARITGKVLADVTKDERQGGKSANFGLLYGMGAYGFREYAEDVYGVVFTIEEATAVRHAFFEMWEGMQEWHNRVIHRVHQTGQVVSPLGRVRRLPQIWDGNDKVASFAERAAINSPVQGFASDLMQMAAASIEGNLPGYDPVPNVRLVGTVHDSILVELPQDSWRESAEACRERMLGLGPVLKRLDCNLSVPLAADIKVGSRWGLSDIGEL